MAMVIAGVVHAAAGCGRKQKDALPAATEWQAPTAGGGGAAMPGPGPTGRGMAADPHAGVPGAPPLGAGGGGADPHAGVPGAPPLGADLVPDNHGLGHGGGAMGDGQLTVDQLGLPPPDRARPVDSTKFLAGTVTAPAGNQAKIPPGAAIFLSVRPADASGAPAGMPLAVDKLVAGGTWPLAFRITEAEAMVGGTAFSGAVVITARFDQDGEARSKQPGDISGVTRATIPADGLVITLDTVQQ